MFGDYTIAYIGQAIVPVADAYAGGVTSDVFNMSNFHAGAFVMQQGAIEDAGISNLVTVLACDDTTPSTTAAMTFRRQTFTDSTKAWAAFAAVTSAGYNYNVNNAVSNGIHIAWFTAEEVEAAGAGYKYVQLSVAETANKTVTAGALFLGLMARYKTDTPAVATT